VSLENAVRNAIAQLAVSRVDGGGVDAVVQSFFTADLAGDDARAGLVNNVASIDRPGKKDLSRPGRGLKKNGTAFPSSPCIKERQKNE